MIDLNIGSFLIRQNLEGILVGQGIFLNFLPQSKEKKTKPLIKTTEDDPLIQLLSIIHEFLLTLNNSY